MRVPFRNRPISHQRVSVPGSKSIANRALVCAALAGGDQINPAGSTTTLVGLPGGDDVTAMLACLQSLGIGVDVRDGGEVAVSGSPEIKPPQHATAFARLAGTTSRFVAALAALSSTPVVVDGEPPLQRRPFGPLFDALREVGVDVETRGDAALPVTITGPPTGGEVTMRGDVSSQFVSALMLVAPVLPHGLEIHLTSYLVSRPYLDITRAVMAQFGHDDVDIDDRHIRVGAGGYTPQHYVIEPDASSASYPLALAAIHGGSITVEGIGAGSPQGDVRFAELMAGMGCEVVISDDAPSPAITVSRTHRALVGIDVDMADISDLVPTVAVVAAVATTPTTIRGVGFIRHKESDRIGDLVTELGRLGVRASETPDGVAIQPSAAHLRPARVATHHDHRLAMAFGVLGSVIGEVDVGDPGVVSKSWPGYWDVLADIVDGSGAPLTG